MKWCVIVELDTTVCYRSLEKAWRDVKTDTSRIAQTHDTAGADFDKLAQEMSSFTDEQKRQSKAVSHIPPSVHTALKTNKLKWKYMWYLNINVMAAASPK